MADAALKQLVEAAGLQLPGTVPSRRSVYSLQNLENRLTDDTGAGVADIDDELKGAWCQHQLQVRDLEQNQQVQAAHRQALEKQKVRVNSITQMCT